VAISRLLRPAERQVQTFPISRHGAREGFFLLDNQLRDTEQNFPRALGAGVKRQPS
jgi:hypothetical protein